MNGVRIYVSPNLIQDVVLDGIELDLFNDENIQINLKQTDITDIGRNIADFTQPFTVPASPKNNKTFSYWYDPFSDAQLPKRIPCRIDINGVFFKKGSIQILQHKKDDNGQLKAYSITFSSELKSLKDKFGETKLSELDFSNTLSSTYFNYSDSGTYSVLNQIINNDNGSIEIPLISTTRLVEDFNTFKYVNSSTTNGLRKEELRPALKFRHLFEAIEDTFDIKFVGHFYNSVGSKLDNTYLWLNKNETPFESGYQVINITGSQSQPFNGATQSTQFYSNYDYFKVTRKTAFQFSIGAKFITSNTTTNYKMFLQQIVLNSDGTVNELMTLAQPNKGFVASSSNWVTGTNTLGYGLNMAHYNIGQSVAFRFGIETKGDLVISSNIISVSNYWSEWVGYSTFPVFRNNTVTLNTTTANTFPAIFNIPKNIPEMSVNDFLQSVIKTFNLVLLPITNPIVQSAYQSNNVFHLEDYNNFYNPFNYVDITKYVKRNSDINDVKSYKKFEFKHSDSSYGTNILYKKSQTPNREFGALIDEYPNGDDKEFKVETKFNLLIFREMLNVGLTSSGIDDLTQTWITCDSLNEDFSKGVFDKPTFFFYNGKSNVPNGYKLAYTNSSNVTSQITQYSIFSNVDNLDLDLYTTTNTFSNESFFNSNYRTKTLYYNNYRKLITGVTSRYVREYQYEANLPKSIYTNLSLGTQLIVGNLRFTISEMNLNLSTGNTKLKLLNIFEEKNIPEVYASYVPYDVRVLSTTSYPDSLGGFIEKVININYPINTASLKWQAHYTLTAQTYTNARVSFVINDANNFNSVLWYDFLEPSGQAVGSHFTSQNTIFPSASTYTAPISCYLRARTGNTITLDVRAYDSSDILLGVTTITI